MVETKQCKLSIHRLKCWFLKPHNRQSCGYNELSRNNLEIFCIEIPEIIKCEINVWPTTGSQLTLDTMID